MAQELTTVGTPAAIDLTSGKVYADACTHCGLCLESCPTYTLWGRESDSPRGRIVLISDAIEAGGALAPEAAAHIDSCLGCMACVTACPEDVRYDELLRRARVAVRAQHKPPVKERLRERALLQALPRSGRTRALARAATIPHFTPAQGSARGRVGLLLGCSQRAVHPAIHQATLGVLAAEGYDVIAPELPDCCGALQLHAGDHRPGLKRAAETIQAFGAIGGVDRIVVSAGGCGAAMRNYGELLGTPQARAFSALVVDVHELLDGESARAPLGPLALRVAYHEACRLRHGQGVEAQPRELLRRIPELELVELPLDAGACCGSPGIYSFSQPQAAAQLGARQARAVLATGAQAVVSGDHACIGQLRRALQDLGRPLPVRHPIELLWSSIRSANGR